MAALGTFPGDYLPMEIHDGVLYAYAIDMPRRSVMLDKHKNYCFVLNVDKEYEPGGHWLGSARGGP